MRAKLADFGGWEMPIEYPQDSGAGVLSEHAAVRERVGLFDVSHLGKAEVLGEGALEFLNSALTNDLTRIVDGQAQYSMLCDEASGGVVDDLIVYRKNANSFFIVPNAANNIEVVKRLSSAAPTSISVRNRHEDYGVLALQGPSSLAVLQELGVSVNLDYMSFTEIEISGLPVTICRTGYTGEFGFELLPRWSDAREIWERLYEVVVKHGGLAAGLGARDTLRTEMGYPLHGQELSLAINPLEAGAGWAVGWKKGDFWGRSILENMRAEGLTRSLRGLLLEDRGVPRAGMSVVIQTQSVGVTTSGTFSPSLKRGIALALLSPEVPIDSVVQIDIRGKLISARVIKPPFLPTRVR